MSTPRKGSMTCCFAYVLKKGKKFLYKMKILKNNII